MSDFPALPGFYKMLFLYIEPGESSDACLVRVPDEHVASVITILPAPLAWFFPGAAWFYHELVPDVSPVLHSSSMDIRGLMAVWQLANCTKLNICCMIVT